MNKKIYLPTIVVLVMMVGFFSFAKKPSYAYWNVLGMSIPSNTEELKITILNKVFNKQKFEKFPVSNNTENNNSNISNDDQASLPLTNTNQPNNPTKQGSSNIDTTGLTSVELTEDQINTLVSTYLKDKNYGGYTFKDLSIKIQDGSLNFNIDTGNGMSFTGKVLASADGENFILEDLQSTGNQKLPAYQLMLAQIMFNKYANKQAVMKAAPEYADIFSHVEFLDGEIRIWVKSKLN
jgi:hypothetical protein